MKKKFVTLLLALTCAVGLTAGTACGGKDDPSDSVTSENGSLSTWERYFVFDNVTATRTTTKTYEQISEGEAPVYTFLDTVQVNENAWSIKMYADYGDEEYTSSAYWDGNQVQIFQNDRGYGASDFETACKGFFSGFEFFMQLEEDFTETASGVFEAEEIVFVAVSGSGQFTFSDVKIVVANQRIQLIEYTAAAETMTGALEVTKVEAAFTNWGTTVIDEEKPAVAWESYFVFDNVTATRTTVQNLAGSTSTYTISESMEIADGKWRWTMLCEYSDDTPSESYAAYWDGAQVTTQTSDDTVSDEMLYIVGSMFFDDVEKLRYLESSFTETEEGVFEASAITEIESSSYTDVKIVVIDGNVAEISYKHAYTSNEGYPMNEEVTMSFLYWGETTVTPL